MAFVFHSVRQREAGRDGFLPSEEGLVFVLGCGMLILFAGALALLWRREDENWFAILTMGFAHLFAGRAASIAQATHAGLSTPVKILVPIYCDVMAMFLCYPVLVFSYKHFFEKRFFQRHMKPVFESARKNMTHLRKSKIAGVFLFVFFPFWMTGIIAGAVLGFLLGLKTWVNMLTVAAGTAVAVVSWVYAYDQINDALGRIDSRLPVFLVLILLLSALGFRLHRKRLAMRRL